MDVSLTVKQSDIARVVQITDTHLFGPDDGSLLSVNTSESFLAVVDAVKNEAFSFDAILATGDISQDHTEASYQRFLDGIKVLEKPCFWLPGNHDYQPGMHSVLPHDQVKQSQHLCLGEHWQVICLDSQVSGVPHGELSQSQLELLDEKLAQYPDRHSLVILHHNPLLVGSAWLDQHCLKSREQFWGVIQRHENVRGVVCGHVHQESQMQHLGVAVITTPSTCIQFKPNSDEFALDHQSPGWRELELHSDGSIKSKVKRLSNGVFLPDFTSSGY